MQRKPRDKGPGEAPGRRRRPMHKRVLTIDLKEYLFFSAGLIFETVLIDVRNQMKNVLDELYVIGLYKPRGKGVVIFRNMFINMFQNDYINGKTKLN